MKKLVQWMVVAITLAVLAPSMQAQFVVSFQPSGLDFGTIEVNTTNEMETMLVYWGKDPAVPTFAWSSNSGFANDQFTIEGLPADSTRPLNTGDTIKLKVTYHPTEAGEHAGSFQCRMLGLAVSLSLKGSTKPATGLTMKQSDCGGVVVGSTATCWMTFTNNDATDMRLLFDGVEAPFAFTTDGGITFIDFLSLAAGESQDLPFTFTPTQEGTVREAFNITNGATTIVGYIEGTGVGDTTPANTISTSPEFLYMSVVENNESVTETVTVTNNGKSSFSLNLVDVIGPDAANFAVTVADPLPRAIDVGESYSVTVTFTPVDQTADDSIPKRARLRFEGGFNSFVGAVAYTDLAGVVVRGPGIDTIRVGLANTGGPVGGTARIVFTNQSSIPSNIAYGKATLRYNASVLVPQETLLDDVTEDGMRTSTFRIDPASRLQGTTLASLKFTITLGDAAQTPVDLVGMEWFDAQDTRKTTETIANGAIVSVDDAEGRTVNANGDIMTLSVSPMPVLDNATISYLRMPGVARLSIFATTGIEVRDLTSILQGAPEQGSVQVDLSSLPVGTYYLRLSVGTSTVVRRIVIN